MSSRLDELIETSLSGYVYDIAMVVHYIYQSKYVCAKLKSRQWYMFDGMRWVATEIGPYHDISNDVVALYQGVYDREEAQLAKLDANEQKPEIESLRKRLSKIEALIIKLKNVTFKESLCRECMYLFYDSDFLSKLDKDRQYICFRNGVLDIRTKEFRQGRREDYISLYIDEEFTANSDDLQNKIPRFTTFRESVILKRKGGQHKFKMHQTSI